MNLKATLETRHLFIVAIQNKFRYPTERGDITTEQLFDLPLTDDRGPNLNQIAKDLNAEIQIQATDFVNDKPPENDLLNARLEVVKMVIATKKEDAANTASAAARRSEIQQIRAAINERKVTDLASKDTDALNARLKELEGASA